MLRTILVATCLGVSAHAQTPSEPSWLEALRAKFDSESKKFDDAAEGKRGDLFACNFYAPVALAVVFKINKQLPEGTAEQQEKALRDGYGDWGKVGDADDVEKVKLARELTNQGTPVIAVGGGHIALLVPYVGETLASGKWKNGSLPCVTNWHKGSKKDSFIIGKLSRAWGRPKGVTFYKLKGASVSGILPTRECKGREPGRGPASPWLPDFED